MPAIRRWRSNLKRLLSYCWFTKETRAFNEFIFATGQKYSRFLKPWFSVGVFFGVFAMTVSIIVLALQASRKFRCLYEFELMPIALRKAQVPRGPIINVVIPGVNVPWSHILYISIGTAFSVGVHEFGHALAAASEGVPTDHIAVFSVVIFSGAFVALSEEALNYLTPSKLLRVHCAGVWHNVVCCLGCWIMLLLLPTLMFPLYTYKNGPVVSEVPENSPLAGHLKPGDVIKAVNQVPVYATRDWLDQLKNISNEPQQGCCAPLVASSSCMDLNGTLEFVSSTAPKSLYCFNATDILNFKTCSTPCSEAEICLQPKLQDWEVLLRISFANNSICKSTSPGMFSTSPCRKNDLLFVGEAAAMASLRMMDFSPRFGMPLSIPRILETFLFYTFSISAALAILNSAPVFYLDGQDILRCIFGLRRSLHRKQKLLQWILVCGTILFFVAILPGRGTS